MEYFVVVRDPEVREKSLVALGAIGDPGDCKLTRADEFMMNPPREHAPWANIYPTV